MTSKLNLNAKVLNENVLDKDVELVEHVIVSRAFKPLQEVLKLMLFGFHFVIVQRKLVE